MDNGNKKRAIQLGMPFGTANGRLRKSLLFLLVMIANLDKCFRCGKGIKDEKDLSIEHKMPWLDSENPKELFFDLDNISFSHISCNSACARQPDKGKIKHPSHSAYRKGCRCKDCIELSRIRMADYRSRRRAATGKDR